MKPFVLGVLIAAQCCHSQADEWGSIRGQIVVEGEIPERQLLIAKDANVKDQQVCAAKDHYAEDLLIDKESRGLANVFVYLAKKPKSIHPDLVEPGKSDVSFAHEGCQFMPHCLVVRVGQTIQIGNEDAISHNTHAYPSRNSVISVGFAPMMKEPLPYRCRIAEAFPFKVGCDYHPWMIGYWLIVDHPYAALTDKDGKFQIDQLPVGEHTFKIWHERSGYLERSFKITVTAGDAVELPTMKLDLIRLEVPTATK